MKRPPLAIPVRSVSPSRPLTRRQWERERIADTFIAFSMSTGAIAATIPGARRYSLSVTLKGRRVVSNLPEIQAALDEAWARMLPSKEQLDREWEQHKRFSGAMRSLGRAAGRTMDQEMVAILKATS